MKRILDKHRWPLRNVPATIRLKQVIQQLPLDLPDDYSYFLMKYEGSEESIGNQYIRLWGLEELIKMNREYQVFKYLPQTVAIGSNGGGEYIALERMENGQTRVVLSPFLDMDSQYHIEIGNSFTDFLKRLDDGKEWFGSN